VAVAASSQAQEERRQRRLRQPDNTTIKRQLNALLCSNDFHRRILADADEKGCKGFIRAEAIRPKRTRLSGLKPVSLRDIMDTIHIMQQDLLHHESFYCTLDFHRQ
jgi:hypothetical protein